MRVGRLHYNVPDALPCRILLFLLLMTSPAVACAAPFRSTLRFINALQPIASNSQAPSALAKLREWESDEIDMGQDWTEAVLSWNTAAPEDARFTFWIQPLSTDTPLPACNMGVWSRVNHPDARQSIPNQSDAWGRVDTDTLVLAAPVRKLKVRIRVEAATEPSVEWIKLLAVACTRAANDADIPVSTPAVTPGRGALEVPQISQLSFEKGKAWCSPTSVTMVLNFWGRQLGRSDLNLEVPDTANGVYDPKWGGTGNWPFNTALAGSFPGMRGFVSRLHSVEELAALTAAGFPVITSVSYNRLKGFDYSGSGHLVVCVGMDARGDVILNDPGTRIDVRKTIPRARFEIAWAESKNTVYLIHPSALSLPVSSDRHW